ncbi:LOW QUALITY PROTEIN: PR domain zinc finger protein 10 [Gastrophryne carolinensis]
MDSKQEGPHVWPHAGEHQPATAQVRFVSDGGAVAQIGYSDEQDRPAQQVVYTADASSFASVDASEHTLVYIHPMDGSQALFTDQHQIAYVQQDATTQQVTVLLPANQSLNAANLTMLSSVPEPAQDMSLEPVSQASLSVHDGALPPAEEAEHPENMAALQSPKAASPGEEEEDEDDDEDEDDEDDDEDEDGEDSDGDEWEPDPPRPFDPNDLWCEECNNAHPSVCPKHGALHPIPNRPVLTRARASLPLVLYIDRFIGGVYSKRRIPKRTQFGPLEGPLVKKSDLKDGYIHLKVLLNAPAEPPDTFQDDQWFDLSDENVCNWMMFVRPAQNHLEQNLVAYQYGQHIYYTTIKNIEPKQELRVWYAASYAEFVNQKIHDISQEERKVLREQEKNWPCYECNRRFMSSEQLQQHLNTHDEKLDFFSRTKGRGRGRTKRKFAPGRRPGRPPKFLHLDACGDKEKCTLGNLELSHFQDKRPGLEEPDHPSLNGLEQSELTLTPVTQEPEEQPQPETPILQAAPPPVQATPPVSHSSLTPEDMRRAKRIRLELQNAALQHLFIRKSFRPFKCLQCGKAFREKDKLEQHLRFHGRGTNCALTCDICNKGFISTGSLETHMRVHLDQKTYSCLFCTDSFDRLDFLKDHVAVHVVDGCFSCPNCKKRFTDFIQVKKHVRSFHSEKIYQCTECDKAFCRPDKLRLHMLRHSDRKDFLCSTCGKQFKRKDKLREHMQRMHNPEREAKKADRTGRPKTFKPRLTSSDYESFMFKCRLCMMGFRRRGMLVNHLSKRHPDMKIEEVPELNLPIIKPNRDYYCQYCEKVYKSASKRKAHILKNHPGAELPPSIRKLRPAGPGEPDPMLSTHTQLTGTIATPPVCCPHCAKQYSSKTKMVQHIRKKHLEFALLPITTQTAMISSAPAVLNADASAGETVVTTDLLTQAMTELSQTLTSEYRSAQGDLPRFQYIQVPQGAAAGMTQPQHIQLQVVQVTQAPSPHPSQHSTVDMGQLHEVQGYTQQSIQVQQIQVTEPPPGSQTPSQVAGQPLSPSSQETDQDVGSAQTPTSQTTSTVQHAYLPSGWNSFRYPSEIQMMLPQGQYVITEAAVGTAVTPVSGSQVKAIQAHYVISEGQSDLEIKKASALTEESGAGELEQGGSGTQTAQYIITTNNMNGGSDVHVAKP